MRKELRRSLFVAAFAGAALAGCGGGGGSAGPSGSPPPPPPPPGPPTAAGSYFLMGRAGGTVSPAVANIPFGDTAVGPSPFGLSFIDPLNLPAPFGVDTGQFQLEAGGTALPLASFSEYLPNGSGSATAWGTRYRVYAKASTNAAGLLYAVDLRKSGATPPANPVPAQLSSGTVTSLQLCSTAPVAFDNYRSADKSWILFHALGADKNCGTGDDNFVAIQLSMNSTMPALTLGQVEPVEALYDTNGTITGFLAISHPTVDASGNPSTPVPLEQLDINLANPKQFTTKLQGKGFNFNGGDFLSLGIASVAGANIWLYWDSSGIYGINLTTGVTSTIRMLMSGDTVNGRGVIDGTKAYVAINNTASPSLGSQIIQIDLANNFAVTIGPRDATLSGIQLVGVTTGALVYFGATAATPAVTNLRSAVKTALATTSTLNNALSSTQSIDSLMGPTGAAGGPVAFLVGDTVFFTVADTSASGATGFAKQAFYVTISSAGTPAPATAVASTVSAVLGVVAPSPISISGATTNAGALVLTMGSNAAAGSTNRGGAAFAAGGTPATTASMGLYSATGALLTTPPIGSLSSMSLGSGGAPLANPIYSVAFDEGPVQSGMPAMLQLTGTAGGAPAEDMAVYTPNTASSLTQVSGFSQ